MGNKQWENIDYGEIDDSVCTLASIRVMLAIAAVRGADICQLDIVGVYLNEVLDHEYYMSQPEGFIDLDFPDHVWHIDHALYRLHQLALIWKRPLQEFLLTQGFVANRADQCVHTSLKPGYMSIWVYVDDMLLVFDNVNDRVEFLKNLADCFNTRDMRVPREYIRFENPQEKNGSIHATQIGYIQKLTEVYGLDKGHPVQSPILPSHVFDSLADGIDVPQCSTKAYQTVIGTVLWVARLTRPDIMFTVRFLGQYSLNPSVTHWNMLMHLVKYLYSTSSLGLVYKKGVLDFEVYVNADFAGETTLSKSITRMVSYLGNSSVDWSSKRQGLIAMSSMEAGFIGLAEAIKNTVWLQHVLPFAGYKFSLATVFEDNISMIAVANSNGTMYNTKHVQLKYKLIKDNINRGIITLERVSTTAQQADVFTKALVPTQFLRAWDMLHLE